MSGTRGQATTEPGTAGGKTKKRGGARIKGTEPKGFGIPVRLEQSLVDAVRDLALVEERSVSDMIRVLVKNQMKLRGLWSPRNEPPPQSTPDQEKK